MTQGLKRAEMILPAIVPLADHDWTDIKQVDKFGANPDISTTTDPEDIWDQGGTYTFLSSAQTLYISSSDNSDTVDITVEGLDANWALQTATKALTGQTQTALAGTWLRVFRAYNADSTNLAGDVYVAETDDLTGGVPDTASKIKAKITSTAQQTLMAIYTIPTGYTGYMLRWYASQAIGQSNYAIVELQAKASGNVFRTKRRVGLTSGGNLQEKFPIALGFAAQTDLKIVCREVGANNMDVSGGFDMILVGT